jgi:hypothetical protein
MQIQTHGNTPQLAPRFGGNENVARMISTIELRDLINNERQAAGEARVRNDQFLSRVEDELGDDLEGVQKYYTPIHGNQVATYGLTLDQCMLVGMRESKSVRRAVLQKLKAMDAPRVIATLPDFSNPAAAARAWADEVEKKQVAEQARLQLSVEVQAQATKIHSLENLFKEGMTHTQFCKGLNGVNVMQVGKFLEGRSWLYNESKSGLRLRVASYARDKYMTEHQHEVTPHGKEPFVSFTPVLLKKGAVRLYNLYLAGELPMKKTWDGLFTHDKALRGAA